MARGYTAAGIVEKHTGQALTADQLVAFDFALEAVEEFIDADTGSAWLTGGVTSEFHVGPLAGPMLFLRQHPVTAVTTVIGHSGFAAADVETLVADTDYALASPTRGMLYLPNFRTWRHGVSVTYTPSAALPWRINRAATLLVAAMLPGAGGGDVDPSLVKSYSVGGDLSVTFRDAVASAADNPDVRRLLGQMRRSLVA